MLVSVFSLYWSVSTLSERDLFKSSAMSCFEIFLIFQRLNTLNSSFDLNFSIKIRNLAVCSDVNWFLMVSMLLSIFSDSLKMPFLHSKRLLMRIYNLFLISQIFFCSSSIFLFWSISISSIWLIVWYWIYSWSEKDDWGASSSDSESPCCLPNFLAASSSFLYLLIRLYFKRSSSLRCSNIPVSWSQAQNKYFTTFGKDKSIMLLKRLLTKFFLSMPYEPDLILNWAIIWLISILDEGPPYSRQISNRSYSCCLP